MATSAPPNKILTPVAPPRILESVYRDDEYDRMLDVIKRDGPWGTIISHHFETVDELIATISGVIATAAARNSWNALLSCNVHVSIRAMRRLSTQARDRNCPSVLGLGLRIVLNESDQPARKAPGVTPVRALK